MVAGGGEHGEFVSLTLEDALEIHAAIIGGTASQAADQLRALRWALVEAAQKITTGSGPLREKFERISKRRGRKIAKVAVAREILTLSYYGLRDGEIRCLARRSRASAKEKLAAVA